MTPCLLDSNALIALSVAEHEHHQRVASWVGGVERVALCPVVEGALVRFAVRVGLGRAAASALLAQLHGDPRCEFWPDAISYCDADLSQVHGHRQVTDAYLVSLAANRGGVVATFDRGLARSHAGRAVLIA